MTETKRGPNETSPLSGKPGRFKTLCNLLIPDGFCYEAKKLLQLTLPAFLFKVLIYLVDVVSSIFCGHLGKIELDAACLALTMINIFGLSVGVGMTFACDTIMSQAFGSKNVKQVGLILQRGILILALCCFPCWALYINTEQFLLLCRQDPDVSRLAQKYVMICVPGLPAVFFQLLLARYLENQGIMWPQVITGVAVNIVNAIINAAFIYVFKLGFEGSAWANTVSQWTLALSLFLYIIGRKLHEETWGGWSKDCLQDWDIFMYFAIPNVLMICIEYWSFEIGGLLAGLISVVELGAQAIIIEVTTLAITLPMSFAAAANVRIGNALGAQDTETAKKSCKVILYCTVFGGLVTAFPLVAMRNVIGYMYTKDRDIIALVSRVMVLYAPFYLCESIVVTCSGILRATGRIKIGAVSSLIGFYVIGLPVGITLMFVAKLGILGLWVGIICPLVIEVCIFLPYIMCLNWEKVCKEAFERSGGKLPDPGISENKSSKAEFSMVENEEIPPGSNLSDITSGEYDMKLEAKDDLKKTTNVVGKILSTKQLIVRRGLAVFLSLSSLIIGIVFKVFFRAGEAAHI